MSCRFRASQTFPATFVNEENSTTNFSSCALVTEVGSGISGRRSHRGNFNREALSRVSIGDLHFAITNVCELSCEWVWKRERERLTDSRKGKPGYHVDHFHHYHQHRLRRHQKMNAPLTLHRGGAGPSSYSSHRPLITQQRLVGASSSIPSQFIHNEFSFEQYIKDHLNVKLDNDAQICPDYSERLQCPRGASCPRRHVRPSHLNFLPAGSTALRDPNKRTVCKHWLRGLCKKDDQCDYLHEYDMRRIPECRFYATFGFCNSGDDCLYLHVDPAIKRRECERYNRGFCPKGPLCTKKHVRRVACPLYLAGFCPEGLDCPRGHVKSTPASSASRSNSPIQTHRPLTAAEAFGTGTGRGDEYGDGAGMRNQRAPAGRYGLPSGGAAGGAGAADIGASRGGMGYANNMQRRPNNVFGAPAQGAQEGGRGWRKDLSEVLCFKCGEMGHFANMCPNPALPGNRGGVERGPGGQARQARDRPRPY